MREVCEFLKKCQTYYLATVEGDQPRVRPFGTAEIFEGRLYMQTERNKAVSKQMKSNPKVEICAYDDASQSWLRIAATAIDDSRREVRAHMLGAYPALRDMGYSEDDDKTQTLYLKEATATFYSFDGASRTVRF
ncbi:MAG: pyridoxamine 5'-phosphate oxidase family protein [Clostridiales Family XIII bacterium]|jgi:uncharacterized pyridoxamine 5'-phosphate oxidase family protein|nr:pyridoxamine 5'-phosphate oxidase family protein [Clostridiales Family XIII bacterium]